MRFTRPTFSQLFTVFMILCFAAWFYSPRVKSWVIMAFLAVGFYKPPVPIAKQNLGVAPPILLHNIKGDIVDLQQQKGKVIFVNFWAVWCPPCLAELPSINKLYAKVKDNQDILFISIDVDNNLPRSSKMLVNRGYQFPVYGGSPSTLPGPYFQQVIPTTVVIDKKGFVVFDHINRADYSDEKFLNYLLALAKE